MRNANLTRLVLAGSAALLVAAASGLAVGGIVPDPILPTVGKAYGKTYGEWSAAWWQWAIGVPCDPADCSAHPFNDTTGDAVSVGQSGKVWFVASAFGTNDRHYTVPRGTALFVAQTVTECSNLEGDPFHGETAAEQSACAKVWGDYMTDVFFEIDGVPIEDMSIHRVQSPQFSFTAPEDNILFVGAGEGTSVSDGYWVFVTPLSVGEHVLHYGGTFADTPFGTFGSDVTDHVTVMSSRSLRR